MAVLPDSQQPHADSKTINISIEKRVNVFTAAFWLFQNINPPTPQGVERVRPFPIIEASQQPF